MNSLLYKIRRQPIALLLAINILIGLLVVRDYGLSWDEPLFYDYANALGYAYSPAEWFSGHFDLTNSYGASGSDHANRGPAYLLLARGPVAGLRALGLDSASAWHLINFLTFQLGVYWLYRLAKRWMSTSAALAAAAFFAWQPLLWGHAFINPKDPPFLVFFLGALCFGFEMVDALAHTENPRWKILFAAFLLGIATSIRVLGPVAGILVLLYAMSEPHNPLHLTKSFAAYFGLAALISYATWPYLWPGPIAHFLSAFGVSSDNPTQLHVLFNRTIYHANALPRRYFPTLLALTLTEPVWPLLALGVFAALRWKREQFLQLALIAAWFVVPFAYAVILQPPMYDGFRHFLFVLPPVFIFTGLAFDQLFLWLQSRLQFVFAFAVLASSALFSVIQLHPYQYTYYNVFVGGTRGAFRRFETDYWLTCYREAVETYQQEHRGPARIFVNREAYIAATYADKYLTVLERRGAAGEIGSGDLVLINTRSNEDLSVERDAAVILEVGRAGATFCVIKRVP